MPEPIPYAQPTAAPPRTVRGVLGVGGLAAGAGSASCIVGAVVYRCALGRNYRAETFMTISALLAILGLFLSIWNARRWTGAVGLVLSLLSLLALWIVPRLI